MEKALYDLTAEDYEKQLRLLLTIKGLGRTTAIALIELTNGFKHFDNPKELANFISHSISNYSSNLCIGLLAVGIIL